MCFKRWLLGDRVLAMMIATALILFSNESQVLAENSALASLPQRMNPVQIAGTDVDVFVLSPTEKIVSTQNLEKLPGLKSVEVISIELAKNESEDILLAVRSSRDVSKVSLRFTALQGELDVLAPQAWQWQKVIEVQCDSSTRWYGTWCPYTGPIADPLVPVKTFDLAAGVNQSLLVNVAVPGDLVAGVYAGKIELLEQQKVLMTLPVKLVVWNVTLPPQRRCKTQSSSYTTDMSYCKFLKSLGIDSVKYGALGLTWTYDQEKGTLVVNTEAYKASMRLWIDEMNFDAICLPPTQLGAGKELHKDYLNTGIPVGSKAFWPVFDQFMKQMADFYRAHGWQDRVIWYMMDEISAEHYPTAAKLARRAKSIFPELKILLTCEEMPHYLADCIDIWVVPWHFFITSEDDVAHWKRLQAKGLKLFAYMNSLYHINADDSLGALRLFPSILAKYHYEGALWYNVSCYGEGDPWDKATTAIFNKDTNKKSRENPNKTKSMANGYLIYPPRDNDPAWHSSLRWESYRQGLDEFEMLEMLRDHYREVLLASTGLNPKENVAALFDVDKAIDHWGDFVGTGFRRQTYRPDAAYIYRFRQLVAYELMNIAKEPLGLVDVDVSGYDCLNDSLRVYGICADGTKVEITNGQHTETFAPGKTFFFETDLPLTPGVNLIAFRFINDTGQSKTLYREVTYRGN